MLQRLWRRNIDEWWQMFNSWVPSGYKHPSVPSHHKWWGNNKQRTLFFSAVFPKCIMELLRCYGCKLPLILLSLSLSLFLSPSLSLFHTSIHSHTRKSKNWVLYKRNKTNRAGGKHLELWLFLVSLTVLSPMTLALPLKAFKWILKTPVMSL